MTHGDYFGIAGKRVLVTGAGTGIGRAIALEFAKHGAHVAFHYSHSSDGASSGARQAMADGVRSVAIQADLSELNEVRRLTGQAEAELGPIDILVNNAGITFNTPFLEMKPEDFQKLFDVNVRAGFFLSQMLAGGMISRGGGVICNITSIHGLQGATEHVAYAGTKGAIIAQTRALGIELAHRGVRVNAIAPGWVDVENHAKAVPNYDPEQAKKAAAETIPVGRYGLPADVARLAVFLCSDAGSFIIGQTFIIDGGTTSLMSLLTDFRSNSPAKYGRDYI